MTKEKGMLMTWWPSLIQFLPFALFVHGITKTKMLSMIVNFKNQTFHLLYLKEMICSQMTTRGMEMLIHFASFSIFKLEAVIRFNY